MGVPGFGMVYVITSTSYVRIFCIVFPYANNSKLQNFKNFGCGVAQLGCGVAQTAARRLAVWQARARISARHLRGGPLPSGSNEEIKSGTRRVLYIKYCMYARLM